MPKPNQPYAPKRSSGAAVTRDQLGQSFYPGKLVENYQGEAENRDGSSRQVWFQRIERCDQQWPDGNLVMRINQPVLVWPDGQFAGKGSEADTLAQAFEDCLGCDMMPGNEESAQYVGHYFMFRDEKIGDTKYYMRLPVDYLGADYSYAGTVRTIEPRGDEAQQQAAAKEEVVDTEAAEALAKVIDGLDEDEIRAGTHRDLVRDAGELAAYSSILGISKVGGFTKTAQGNLMDKLVAEGYGEIIDGCFVAKAAVAA